MKKEELKEMIEATMLNGFLLVKNTSQEELINLADWIKRSSKIWDEIYWLGVTSGDSYPYFESIRIKPRIVLQDKNFRVSYEGLIYPQDKPIILVIENFDKLTPEDQFKYSTIVWEDMVNDVKKLYIHSDSLVIVSYDEGSKLNINYKCHPVEYEK